MKTWVKEVENTMKETLESVDKLQEDLDEANAAKLALKNQANCRGSSDYPTVASPRATVSSLGESGHL